MSEHTPEPCPVCGEGHLSRPFSIKECDSCGSDVSTPDLVEMNHRLQQAERQRDELLAALKKYGMHERNCIQKLSSGFADHCTCGLSDTIAKASGQQ